MQSHESFCFSISHLKEEIARVTDMKSIDQILIYDHQALQDIVTDMCPIRDYPRITEEKPIYLMAKGAVFSAMWGLTPYNARELARRMCIKYT